MWVMLLIFSTPAATLPAAQHSTLQYEANGYVECKSIFLTFGKNICYCDIYNGLYLHCFLCIYAEQNKYPHYSYKGKDPF